MEPTLPPPCGGGGGGWGLRDLPCPFCRDVVGLRAAARAWASMAKYLFHWSLTGRLGHLHQVLNQVWGLLSTFFNLFVFVFQMSETDCEIKGEAITMDSAGEAKSR